MAVAVLSAGRHRPDVASVVDELERQGQPVTLVCLDRSRHEHQPTAADVLHPPMLSAAVLSSLVIRVIREPIRILRMIIRVCVVTNPRLTVASLVRLPAAIHIAQILSRRGITEVRPTDGVASRIGVVVTQLSDRAPADLTALPLDWSRLSAGGVGVRWFSRRINSIAAEVSVGADNQRAVVKRRQQADAVRSAVDRTAHEYRVLRMLSESMADDTLTVPRVLLFDAEAAILVMERARGTTLEALFAAAAADRGMLDRLAEGIRGAGAWLAAMQAATPGSADGRALLTEVVSAAVGDAAKVAVTDRIIRRHHREIVARLDTLERSLSGRPLAVSGHHGDYFPGNVFFDGERVTVIDFESFRVGLWLEDVAYFFIRSEMLRRRFRLSLPDLAQRFFDGYSGGRKADGEALRLFTLTNGLRNLANGVGEDLPMPQRVWTRRTIAGAVLGAMREG